MKLSNKISLMLGTVAFLGMGAGSVLAAPRFTLTPATGTYNNGDSFSVVIGVNSDTEKAVAMDVVASFDATKLEVVSITKVANPVFNFAYDANTAIIHNDTGRFEITLSPISSSIYDGAVMNGDLLSVNFRTKATGVAAVAFTCQAGSVVETNIINDKSVDVVSCSANQSGSYTINAGVGGAAAAASPTATPTTGPSPTARTLPQTGVVENTIVMIVVGVVAMVGAILFAVL